jgi:hypothetical protein
MRFMGLLKSDAETEAGVMPTPELIEKMNTFMEEITNAGVLLATDGLKPSSAGKRVKLENGKLTVIDGPFAEAKELIAGYAIYDVKSMDEAIYWTQRFLEVMGSGECEIRPFFELSDFPEDVVSPEEAAKETALRETMQRNAQRS